MTPKFRAFIKSKAHLLDPVLRIGKEGLKEETIEAIELYLNKNEVMKIQILNNSDITQEELFLDISNNIRNVEFIQSIGHVLVIYKESQKKIFLDQWKNK